jgi:hypothetical protein
MCSGARLVSASLWLGSQSDERNPAKPTVTPVSVYHFSPGLSLLKESFENFLL